ncbi:MAG: cobalamin B12-binding domain-containing protein [Candidatus Helarchaeota archaeon]|nr:cobalamin B12-binding domain-containing protein [Candidatus Helarchaeota archaeon]
MVKILLINPIFQKSLSSPLPDRIERSRGRYPPIGLAYLASMLLRHNHTTQIYDADVEKKGIHGLIARLKRFKPDIVGITTTSFTFLQAKITAKTVRMTLPEAKVLVGGPHVSIYPEEVLRNEEFDIAVKGEGEYTVVDLIEKLETNSDIRTVQGIVYHENGKIHQNELRPPIENLDELPFPARKLLPNKKYYYPLGKKNPFTTVISSRGCPFNCIFCLRAAGTHFGRKFRARSPLNICEELEHIISSYDIREIFFYDDVFTANQKRIEDLCREIIRRKIDISWNCRTRVDTVTPKLLKLMKGAGCERIHYGIESGDENILKNLRKNITISQIRNGFSWTKANEIETFAYIMLGAPGETSNSIRRTMQLLKKIQPSHVGFFITTLFPGTNLYTSALEENLLSTDVWKDFTLGKMKDQPLPYLEEAFNEAELKNILKKCYREYYFRLSYIWNRLKTIKSFSQLLINLKGFSLILNI